jgi:hypothetical protein
MLPKYPNAFHRHAVLEKIRAIEERYWIRMRSINLDALGIDQLWRRMAQRHHEIKNSLDDRFQSWRELRSSGEGEIRFVDLLLGDVKFIQ